MNLSIVKKGLILAAIPLVTQLVFLAVLFKMRQEQLQAQEMAIHGKDVIARTEGAFRLVMEARAAVRSLTLTGDPAFVSAWEKVRKEASAQLLGLRNLVNDNPQQQMRIDRTIRQTEEALTRMNAIVQLARKQETRSRAVAALVEPWALRFVDDLRLEIDDFLIEEELLDGERQGRLERVGKEEMGTLIGGAVLTLLSTAALAFLFRRGITLRLAVLSENVRRLAAGEQLAPPLGGLDELGHLDRVFHEMADTLAQKDRENEMFVYSVSHDLRSPLVNLQGFSQELALACKDLRRIVTANDVPPAVRERAAALLDRDVGESIHFIQTAVRRLATIIDALLRLSRVGRLVYDWQQVDVREVVERVVAALSNTISQKGAQVRIGDLPPAWGDPTAIEQIFANLIDNALKYLDPARPGIIEVGIRPSNAEQENENAIDRRNAYYVKDNGIGIEPEHRAKVFLAFQRLHPTIAPGEGIGLPMIRRMVERHGGQIWIESAVDQGSTFFVTLPTADRRDAASIEQSMVNGQAPKQGEHSRWQRNRSA